jgi:TetR/AcrR family fatty acid metabolism transcriptional regulator
MATTKKDDKREKILDSAIAVFARQGFFNSTVAQIAKGAGVADGTIYLYFKNKDDILITIFEEKMQLIIDGMKQVLLKIKDPQEQLRLFIMHHLRLVEEQPNLSQVIQVELRQSNTFMKEYLPVKFIEYLDILSDIILSGQKLGLFRRDLLPEMARRAIFGAVDEIALHWVLTQRQNNRNYQLEQSAGQVADIFIKGMAVAK